MRPRVAIDSWLLPLSWLYGLGVWLRNFLFDKGILSSRRFDLPIVSVGNITVGGTGKTPHVEYLIRLLQDEFQIAVLSRGYRRKSRGFVRYKAHTKMEEIGDEPFQMATKFPKIMLAVDADRVHGVETILNEPTMAGVEAVVLDDAFQHRYIHSGLQIVLIDYHRPIFEDALLPAGRLREPAVGVKRAQLIVVTKCPPTLSELERQWWLRRIQICAGQEVFFSTLDYGELYPLFDTDENCVIDSTTNVLLLTGIVNPKPIENYLGLLTGKIHSARFPDHHQFSEKDLKSIELQFHALPRPRLIVTTEKDAARLKESGYLSDEVKAHLFVLPVEVRLLFNEKDSFNKKITAYVRENSRNSSFSKS